MEWTGERLVADTQLGKGVIEHLHRYAFALEFVKDKYVIDIASGEGYGSNLLSKIAKKVIGIDISKEAVDHANNKYQKSNLNYIVGSVTNIPLPTGEVDVVISYETLEHLLEQDEMLSEIHRVLNQNGLLIISTPERENYRKFEPNNKYHLKELDKNEFYTLLKKYFSYIEFYDQHFCVSSVISPFLNQKEASIYSGNFNEIEKEEFRNNRIYNIAICSNVKMENNTPEMSFFEGDRYYKDYLIDLLQKHYLEKIDIVYNSRSYKIGNFLIKPISFLKQLLSKSSS